MRKAFREELAGFGGGGDGGVTLNFREAGDMGQMVCWLMEQMDVEVLRRGKRRMEGVSFYDSSY